MVMWPKCKAILSHPKMCFGMCMIDSHGQWPRSVIGQHLATILCVVAAVLYTILCSTGVCYNGTWLFFISSVSVQRYCLIVRWICYLYVKIAIFWKYLPDLILAHRRYTIWNGHHFASFENWTPSETRPLCETGCQFESTVKPLI